MLYNYVAFAFFSLVAIAIPAFILLYSKLVRRKEPSNSVKSMPYEGGEEPNGSNRDADLEYLPYTMFFLPFGIIAVITLLWSQSVQQNTLQSNLMTLGLLAMAAIFAVICYVIIREEHE